MLFLNECSYKYLSKSTKVFVNGAWIGIIDDPEFVKKLLLDNRRNGLIPIYLIFVIGLCDYSTTSCEKIFC